MNLTNSGLPSPSGSAVKETRPNGLKAAKLQQNFASSAKKYALSVLAQGGHILKREGQQTISWPNPIGCVNGKKEYVSSLEIVYKE